MSKTFKKYWILIPLVMFILTAGAIFSIPKYQSHPEGRPFRVAIIHSYDSLQETYPRFDKEVKKAIKNARIQANYQSYYLDDYDASDLTPKLPMVLQALKQQRPDIILLEDDFGVLTFAPLTDSLITHTPIVIGNMHTFKENTNISMKQLLKGKKATAFIAPLKFQESILLTRDLSGENVVEIELDYNPGEEIMREYLLEAIKDTTRFLTDTQYLSMGMTQEGLNEKMRDKTIVTLYSLKEPERNPDVEQSRRRHEIEFGSYFPSLVVKKDLYADGLALTTDQPQFTMVNLNFNNSEHNYVGGCFCPIEDVARDMAGYAIRVLKGEDITTLPIAEHRQHKMVDWIAYQNRQGDKAQPYEALAQQYQVINVPFKTRHPQLFLLLAIIAILLILGLLFFLLRMWSRHVRRKTLWLKEQLIYENRYGNLIFLGINSCTFHYDKEVGLILGENTVNNLNFPQGLDAFDKVALQVRPDYLQTVEEARRSIEHPGEYDLMLPMTLDKGMTYHWFQLRYSVTGNSEKLSADGLLIDADETIARELQLAAAKKQEKASRLKDKFMNDLRDHVSRPLDKILKQSEILSEYPAQHTMQEYMEVVEKLNKEGHSLMELVNQILELVRLESGRVKVDIKPLNLHEVFRNFKLRWQYQLPAGFKLEFKLDEELETVMADELRLNQWLDTIMANALKNLTRGTLTWGTNWVATERRVEIYLEDNSGETMDVSFFELLQKRFEEQRNFDLSMGLELNLVNAIAWNMKGRMALSCKEGKGSRFGIILDEK